MRWRMVTPDAINNNKPTYKLSKSKRFTAVACDLLAIRTFYRFGTI